MKCTYEEGEQLLKTHICGYQGCTRQLVITWYQDHYDVHCTEHPLFMAFKPVRSDFDLIPGHEEAKEDYEQAITRRRAEAAKQGKQIVEHRGRIVSDIRDAGTRQLATADHVRDLIEFADRYNLDLYRNHVCLMYGKPYVEIDGLYWLARQTEEFNGVVTRPLFLHEKDELGWDESDFAWTAEVYRKGCDHSFTGWDRTTQAKLEERSKDGKEWRWPLHRERPDRMTEKQAIRYALRAAFPDLQVWESEE